MILSPRTRRVLGYIGIAVAAALIAGGVVWAIANTRILEEAKRAEEALGRLEQLESDVESLKAQLVASGASLEAEPLSETNAGQVSSGTESADSGADTDTGSEGRQFCFVRGGVWEGAMPVLTLDYAQMLSGDEAAAAAAEHGDESPPPNDYYIVNDNTRLRELPADSRITVTVTSMDEGVDPGGYDMAFGQWFDVLVGMSASDFVKDRPYWITIEGGKIVAIEEQYLP